MGSIVLVSLLISIFCSVNSSRILGIVPTPSFSHQIAFQPIWEELSRRGHEVVVITTNPINNSKLVNLTEIDVSGAYEMLIKHKLQEKIRKAQEDPIGFVKDFSRLVEDVSMLELEHPEVQKLIHDENEHFDVVIVEALYTSFYAFSERFKCPLIGGLSLDATNYLHNLMGNPAHPVLYPDFTLPFQGELTFKERLRSTIYELFMRYFRYAYVNPRDQKIIDKYFPNATLTRQELEDSMSMLFTNVNPVYHENRPLGLRTIAFGGFTHIKKEKQELPKEIKTYLDNAKNGVLYFSLGTNVQSKDLEGGLRKIFLEVMAELPLKVLWKFENDQLEDLPDNVKIVKWLPQQDVLRHPNIKLFVNQGGLQSIEESVYNHVPLIAIPFFADQIHNARRLAEREIGIHLDKQTLTKESLKDAIFKILNNDVYHNNVKKFAELTKDIPMSGLDQAIWWTEYVIRQKGTNSFASPGKSMPWYQLYLIDVYGFLLAITLTILTSLTLIIRTLLRFVIGQNNKPKLD